MRALFFVEPFPVRGAPEDFDWVFRKWAELEPGLRDLGIEAVFACSDALAAVHPDAAIMTPSALGVSVNPADATDDEWVALMRRDDHPIWRPFVDKVLERSQPDVVISWTVNRPLQAAARLRRIPILHCELGLLRLPEGNLYYADPGGLNGASSVPQLWESIRDVPLTDLEERVLDRFIGDFVRRPTSSEQQRAFRNRCGLRGRKPVVAAFLQVPRDSNVLAWSNVRGDEGLLEAIRARFPSDGFDVVVKPHPQAPFRDVTTAHMRLAPECSAQDVIDIADAVCTINSSVGVEALAAGKPLYAFGHSPYAVDGCVRDALLESAGPITPLSEPERALARRLMYFLFFRYLVSHDDLSDADALAARLERLVTWNREGGSLLQWFTPDVDGAMLRSLRARRREHAARVDLTVVKAAMADEVGRRNELMKAAAEARTSLGQLQSELATRESELGQLRVDRQRLSEGLADAQARYEATAQHVANIERELAALEASLPMQVGKLVKRIPLAVPLARLVKKAPRRPKRKR